ncbi:hypothetical protein BLNAU_20204 [Blattamonas nauphoetae]|uniref:Protein kinase domain-containing protein n=1 Tax=Blattamonas nauphoetae TaxID=2049346 RepID=A0ABQ9X2M4_9EUKA|nr:hypothetical protein BLNAU_20204 [Blattamonas nauphoetae]
MTSWYLTIDGSEIISNKECSPFIVTNDLDGHGCQIQIIRSSHTSKSTLVLPLVGTSQNARGTDLGMHLMPDSATDKESRDHVSISGVELMMQNQHFPLGTGPIFTFRTHCAFDCAMDVDTSLLESSLVNVTSSSRMSLESHRFGSEVSQRVVGSCVDQSTNHDSGTGIMSPNMGGNVMCLNTSFSSCIRDRNTVMEFSLENRSKSITDRLVLKSTSGVTSVSFTLCTFQYMYIYDKDVPSNSGGRAANDISGGGSFIWGGGAAISLNKARSSLTITSCFFQYVRCDANDYDGGAVFFSCGADARDPISITNSSFSYCYSDSYEGMCCGGSLFVHNASTVLLERCFFDNNGAHYDGAADLRSEIVTLSECSFIECWASNGRAGAVTIFQVTTVSLSSCVFRSCKSSQQTYAKDVYLTGILSTEVTSDMFMLCDSTSGSPNVYFYEDKQDGSYLIPQVTSSYTVDKVTATFSKGEATVTVETCQAIKGLMRMLIKNGSNVPRLVHVTIGQPHKLSKTGTGFVQSEILPNAIYTHHISALAAFPPTNVHTAESSLKDPNTTEIVLKGISLDKGSYWMLVKEGENELNVSLAWSNFETLTGTAPLYPSTAEGRLKWETEYEVTKVMWISEDGLLEEEVAITETVTFTTPPEPPVLVTFVINEYDENIANVYFNMTGTLLDEDETYKIGLNVKSNLKYTVDMKYNKTIQKWNGSAVVYGSNKRLAFGQTYTVSSFKRGSDTTEFLRDALPEITIMDEPPRLTNITAKHNKTYSTLTLASRLLTVGSEYWIQFVGKPSGSTDERTATLNITVTSATSNTLTGILYPFADDQLLYDRGYVPVKMARKNDSSRVMIDKRWCSFWTPDEPERLTGFKLSHYDSEYRNVFFEMEGRVLDENVQYKVVLEQPSCYYLAIDMTFNTANRKWEGSSVLYPSTSSRQLVYGETCTVISFKPQSGIGNLLFDKIPKFEIMPEPARLVSISTTNTDDICSWTTGLIRLNSCDVEVLKTAFIHLPSGAIEMKGGVLMIRSSSFESNTHPSSPFPSIRRNIHCSEEGKIEIVDTCSLSVDDVESNAPLFVPTLSPNSTSAFEKKKNVFNVVVLGTTLIPCGLSLEVFEMQKNDVENNAVPIPLDPSSSTSFTDTNITLSIDRSSFSLLSDKHEWRGRLIFGNDQRTSTSFQIQTSLSERRSESVKENMKWWLPLVIVLVCLFVLIVIVAVILWRRKQKKGLANNMEEMAIQQIDEEKVIMDEFNENPANSARAIASSAQLKTDSGIDNTHLDQARGISISNFVEVVVCGDGYEMSTANETDTLYSALHSKDSTRELCKLSVQQQIARGLVSLAQVKPVVDIMTKLSSHWVLFDGQGRICLKTRSGDEKSNQEFQRWMAPEVANVNAATVTTQAEPAAVFSLGLVLWEIETGLVPFAEVDEQTAQRRLRLGEKPNMEKVSEEMQAIIDSCLTLDASQRPSLKTVSSLLDQLDGSPIESDKHLNKLASKTN